VNNAIKNLILIYLFSHTEISTVDLRKHKPTFHCLIISYLSQMPKSSIV